MADGAPMSNERAGMTLQVDPAGQRIARHSDEEPAAVRVEAGDELVSHRRDKGGIDRRKRKPGCPSAITDRDPAVNKLLSQTRTNLPGIAALAHHRNNRLTHTCSLAGPYVRLAKPSSSG
jgi:hypothetical protein